ncbi:MAG: hypothetical protein P8K80_01480 [Phycisphaerales bacterium]|nr:hypothetical protein [Phycisphaerales bacterium]
MVEKPANENDKHFRNPDLPPDLPVPEEAIAKELPVVEGGPDGLRKKIKVMGPTKRHEDEWTRTPNTTGIGAIHCRSFFTKLNQDAVAYMDQSINEWLDENPQYEVKFVSSTIGTMRGKVGPQEVMICQVWV